MTVETDLLASCVYSGKCREIMFEKYGISTDNMGPNGINYVMHNGKRLNYECCTQCHAPVNSHEAARINGLLGLSAKDIKLDLDDDFLLALDKVFDG